MKRGGVRAPSTATLVVSALLLVAAPMTIASDATSQCGAAGAKAVAALIRGIVTEATRACVAGSAGHPQPVDTPTLSALVDKVNAQFQKAIDKFGDANCSQKPTTTLDNAVTTAQRLADELCLVPSPTPTP